MKISRSMLYLVGIGTIACMPLGTCLAASEGIVIDPIKETVTIEAGETRVTSMAISNDMGVSQVFTISFKEFTVDSAGMPSDLSSPSADDPASWFTASPSEFTLNSGESKTIEITVTSPAAAKEIGYYVAASILVGGVSDQQASNETKQEIQTLYSVVVGEPAESLEITQISTADGRVIVRLHNPGLVHTTASGKLDLTLNGEVVETYSISAVNIFPAKYRDVSIAIDSPERDDYTAKVSLAYGRDNTVITAEQKLSEAATADSSQAVTVKNTATVVSDNSVDAGQVIVYVALGLGVALIAAGAVLTFKKK